MTYKTLTSAILGVSIVALAACSTGAANTAKTTAQPVSLLASGAFTDAHAELQPLYLSVVGAPVKAEFGSSLASVSTSVPARLQRGESADVVLISKSTLNDLVQKGQVQAGTQVDLMRSSIGLAVRAGSPIPSIKTVEEFKQALLNAKSIAYSASLSGVYYEKELLKRLGVEAAVLPKSKKVIGEKVGQVVARGEAEIGIQQVSELVSISGISLVGKIPESVQQYTVMSAGISTKAANPSGAKALLDFYKNSPEAHKIYVRNGLEPVGK
ncbi:molybdate ABC transporter substrate-binding protein [Ottowia thiooxydans]|uniref:molybdate ABC transporter substrate-binding protein n=1 Tax=Ottowia thiooxydans TaxID=219182 RepID=UPI0004011C00|nr:substrate-binding domain-containing protein [Ottowia thiooxydans]